MGIIKWWNDRRNKSAVEEVMPCSVEYNQLAEEIRKLNPNKQAKGELVLPAGWEKVEVKVFDNDTDRVEHYKASGGEIVDLSNKPRLENDGFPPDRELMTPFNEAHLGTKAGLASMVGRKR
jgi:hypothetical protein